MAEAPGISHHPAAAPGDLALPRADGVATVAAAAPMRRWSLRVAPEHADTLAAALAFELQGRINSATGTGDRAALRLGPDEWLLLDAGGRAELAGPTLPREPAHALVGITDRQIGLVLAGPRVEDVLAAGCPLPLDGAAFPPGRATRTALAKLEIVLWRQAADRFHIEVGRSFTPYAVAFLAATIAAEAAIARLGQATRSAAG